MIFLVLRPTLSGEGFFYFTTCLHIVKTFTVIKYLNV